MFNPRVLPRKGFQVGHGKAALWVIGLSLAAVLSGCAKKMEDPAILPDALWESPEPFAYWGMEVAEQAKSQIGVRYRWGGETPERGFDCSGLVRWVFQRFGVELPRSSMAMRQEGIAVEMEELLPGDLVFFDINRRRKHVGIVTGKGTFVHSPRRGDQVREESLELAYWSKRYRGARRILED